MAMLLWKEVGLPCYENLQIVYRVIYRNIPDYFYYSGCNHSLYELAFQNSWLSRYVCLLAKPLHYQRSAFLWLLPQNGAFSLWCKGKPLSYVKVYLHCIVSNLKNTRKMSAFPPLEKFRWTPIISTVVYCKEQMY